MHPKRFISYCAAVCVAALGTLAPAAAQAQTTIPINPKATYLRLGNDPNALPAPAINLSDLGLQPGDPILLERLGAFQFSTSGPETVAPMAGVFSSTNVLGPATDAHRVPGAIDAGPEVLTFPALNNTLPTDIPEDFAIARFVGQENVVVTIPQGAQYLFISPNESFFGDNTSVGYALRITLLDSDRDGVLDADDAVVNSDMRPFVDTGSGSTSVANLVDESGRTIQDYINAFQAAATNHGQYVSAVAQLADQLVQAGLITGAQKGELVSGAAGKKP
jgi:hypothetical protein